MFWQDPEWIIDIRTKNPFQEIFTRLCFIFRHDSEQNTLQDLEKQRSWQVFHDGLTRSWVNYRNKESFSRFCSIFRHDSEQNTLARSWKAKILTSFSKWSNKILSESFQDIRTRESFSKFYKMCFIFRHDSEQNVLARSWKSQKSWQDPEWIIPRYWKTFFKFHKFFRHDSENVLARKAFKKYLTSFSRWEYNYALQKYTTAYPLSSFVEVNFESHTWNNGTSFQPHNYK